MILAGFALGIDGELDEVILHTLCAILSNETKRVGKVSALNIATGCCKCLVSARNELLYQNEVLILIEYVYTFPIKMKT